MGSVVGVLGGILFCIPFIVLFAVFVLFMCGIIPQPHYDDNDEYIDMALVGPIESDIIAPYE